MIDRSLKALWLAGSALGFSALMIAQATAGGLAVREQSAYGQGSSFAGVAAGGALSSMFWNPATMTQVPGIQTEASISGIIGSSTHTPTAGTLLVLGGAGDSAKDALVPSSYASWQFNPNMWLGLSINAPFGLSVGFPNSWAGRNYAQDSSLKTFNFTPSFAVRINEMISIGFGVQIQYAKAELDSGILFPPLQTNIEGDGFGYGATLGITVTPTPNTQIGLGWRSAINQKIEGTLAVPALIAPISTPGAVETTLNLPDLVTFGIRHRFNPQWMVMGTVEWSNWSRIGTSNVTRAAGGPALVALAPVAIPFQYSDGWFYSLGAEYQWSPALALRAGIGLEKSPITDLVRTPRLPDNNRTWLSLGGTYNATQKLTLDFAYSHIFVKDTPIAITAASGNPNFSAGLGSYTGSADSHVDIISVALRYRWDDPPPPAHKTKLWTK